MRKTLLIFTLCFCIVCAMLVGCTDRIVSYSFRQSLEDISKVEICTYDIPTRTRTPVVTLSEKEYLPLLNEFTEMTCMQYFSGDHARDYGSILFCIYYNNGEIEVIGQTNIGWITADGKWHTTDYTFDWEEMKELILHYVPEEYQPEY